MIRQALTGSGSIHIQRGFTTRKHVQNQLAVTLLNAIHSKHAALAAAIMYGHITSSRLELWKHIRDALYAPDLDYGGKGELSCAGL